MRSDAKLPTGENELGIRVVVVEAQPATAAGVSAFLAEAGCNVVATIEDASSLKVAVRSFAADVVVFDPEALGDHHERPQISAIVAEVDVPLLAFALDVSPPAVHRLLEAGVMGVVPRSANAAELVEGVRIIATGVQHLHPLAVTAWLQGIQSASRSVGGVEFSARECRVLEFIAEGSTNAAIASRLEVSVSTVKSHVAHLLTKLDACDRAQAVSIAIRRGVIN